MTIKEELQSTILNLKYVNFQNVEKQLRTITLLDIADILSKEKR